MYEVIPTDFLREFTDEVIRAVLGTGSRNLYHQFGLPPRLFLTEDKKIQLETFATKCVGQVPTLRDAFTKWFVLAFEAGLVQHCRKIDQLVLVRTALGYQEWSALSKQFPATLISERLSDRKKKYETVLANDPLQAEELLRLPLFKVQLTQEEIDVQQAVRDSRVLKHLCPALDAATEDVFEIAKTITPILLGLILAGTIVLPLVPALFAGLAILISRIGVAALCVDYLNGEDKA